MDCSPPGSSVHGDSPGKNTGVDFHVLLQGNLPNLGIKPRSPILQADSLPTETPGKPQNTGVGTLSILQRIFLTHKLNQGLLHCRKILYQLSYQGTDICSITTLDIVCVCVLFCFVLFYHKVDIFVMQIIYTDMQPQQRLLID